METNTYPLLPLRGINAFPNLTLHFDVGREKSVQALRAALEKEQNLFLTSQKDMEVSNPEEADLYSIGTMCKVQQVLALPGDHIRVLVEGLYRAKIVRVLETEPYMLIEAEQIEPQPEPDAPTLEQEATMRVLLDLVEQYASLSGKLSSEALTQLAEIKQPGRFTDKIALETLLHTDQRQAILETVEVGARMELMMGMLKREIDLLTMEKKIQQRVRVAVDKSQKEYYLREQMKAIQTELGDEDSAKEIDALRAKADKVQLSEQAREKVHKEIDRLARLSQNSPEAAVSQTYIETILELPWGVRTEDNFDLDNAQRTLDDEHFGLDKVKERIMEYLAVCQKKKDIKGPILCFVGPPGTGKTSISRSIAHAMGRKFCRMSLGGVRDEAEIRGHRRTYIGAIPGAILNHIKQAGTQNPVFLLDEIDKMSSDFRGDPASAMLEVLDPEQNKTFRDHYLELDFDLSHVLFITTANSTDTIPRPLLDRMEVIEVSSYLEQEKLQIAKRYLVPKQAKENGIALEEIEFTDDALLSIIRHYTAEAGVRGLERQIATACRKAVKRLVGGEKAPVRVAKENLEAFLGPARYFHDKAQLKNKVGVATGLAWTAIGGTTLQVEVSTMKGTGQLELTGQLGDVMKESAKTAVSCLRTRYQEYKLDPDFYQHLDLHIHLPEGATPKDGPSAGVTLATAVLSALTGRPVRGDIAMTGEITLRGRVLPVGGIREKLLAALRDGIHTVLIPKDCVKDLKEIPEELLSQMHCIPVETIDDVLNVALLEETDAAN